MSLERPKPASSTGRSGGNAACPICGKPQHNDYRPFCSRRCADVDLGRWLGGRYAIPTSEPAGAGDDGADGGDSDEE